MLIFASGGITVFCIVDKRESTPVLQNLKGLHRLVYDGLVYDGSVYDGSVSDGVLDVDCCTYTFNIYLFCVLCTCMLILHVRKKQTGPNAQKLDCHAIESHCCEWISNRDFLT